MSSLFTFLVNPTYPIVIAQYKRDSYGVGQEEELHWALIVLTSQEDMLGPCFQAFDRRFSATGEVQWVRHYSDRISLTRTRKCLGGAQIGAVSARRLAKLVSVIITHDAVPRFEGWNCRDWIIEVIELLKPHGWIDETLIPGTPTQESILPLMKRASRNTEGLNLPDTKRPLPFKPFIEWAGGGAANDD